MYLIPKITLTCPILAVSRKLRKYEPSGTSRECQTSIKFNIESIAKSADPLELEMDDAVARGKKEMKDMSSMPVAVDVIQGAIDTYQSTSGVVSNLPILPAWEPFLEKVELFTKLVDGIAEVRYEVQW
jgi:hypothetical protein